MFVFEHLCSLGVFMRAVCVEQRDILSPELFQQRHFSKAGSLAIKLKTSWVLRQIYIFDIFNLVRFISLSVLG